MIKTYNPAFQVTLIKTVARKNGVSMRYAGSPAQIDLTPFLGDSGAVRTRKSVHEPDGRFSITFPDKMDQRLQDSLYGLIEPMDIIEIRATRQPNLYVGGKLPLIMRGIVSAVSRPEAMDNEGKPSRKVVVHGQDAGKFWLIYHIWFEVANAQEQPMLLQFALNSALGLDTRVYPLSTFMETIAIKVVNPKISAFATASGQKIAPFTARCSVKRGSVIPQIGATYQGNVWGLVETYAERPWNEMFILDEEAGPVFVFREVPFKDIDGKLIMKDAADPGTVKIDWADVVSWNATRSDAGVANFFVVPPGVSTLLTNGLVAISDLMNGIPFDFNHGNNDPTLYGNRKMTVGTRVQPTGLADLPAKLPEPARAGVKPSFVDWHLSRRDDLKALNRDNIVFEDVIATVRGMETLQIGKYLSVTRGAIVSEAYISSVEHAIVPLQSWTTNLGMERGTGFLQRSKYAGSPYLAEGRNGPYTVRQVAN